MSGRSVPDIPFSKRGGTIRVSRPERDGYVLAPLEPPLDASTAGESNGQAARSHDHGVRGHGRLRDGTAAHPVLRSEHGRHRLHRRAADLVVFSGAAWEGAKLGEGLRPFWTPAGRDYWFDNLGAGVCRLRPRRDALDPAALARRAGRWRWYGRRAAGVRRRREQAGGPRQGTRLALRRDERRRGGRPGVWLAFRPVVGPSRPGFRRGRILPALDAVRVEVSARIEGNASDRRAFGAGRLAGCGERSAGPRHHECRRSSAAVDLDLHHRHWGILWNGAAAFAALRRPPWGNGEDGGLLHHVFRRHGRAGARW